MGATSRAAVEHPTAALSEFVAGASYEELPERVVHEAKRLTLDVIGNIIGGSRSLLGEVALRYVEAAGGSGESTIIGTGRTTSVAMAAYANARIADALDSVDTFMAAYHLGGPTASAAFTLADATGRSGRDFLTAVAVGMEVAARVAASVGPAPLRSRVGAEARQGGEIRVGRMPAPEVGAAISAAKVLGLDAERVAYVLGVAGAISPINATRWGELHELPIIKAADSGVSALTGVSAALNVASGMTAHPGILDGERGLWKLRNAPACDFELMVGGLGDRWLMLDNTYKPWASCRWTHHGATMFERIQAEESLRPEEIDEITLHGHPWVMAPHLRSTDPKGVVGCVFNQPHTLAMMALGIPTGPWWYTEDVLGDPRVQEFRRKVRVELEPESLKAEQWYVDGQIRRLPSRLAVSARGRVFEARTDYAKGDPWGEGTYLTDEELFGKFLLMGSRREGADSGWARRAHRIGEAVWGLDGMRTMEPLGQLCRGSGPSSLLHQTEPVP